MVAARQRLGVRLQERHLLQAVGQQRQHRPRHQQRRARRQLQRGPRLALRRWVAAAKISQLSGLKKRVLFRGNFEILQSLLVLQRWLHAGLRQLQRY